MKIRKKGSFMKKVKQVVVISEDEDKPNCFAWISKKKCNALSIKNCKECSFYQHYSKVPNYTKYFSKEDLAERRISEKAF